MKRPIPERELHWYDKMLAPYREIRRLTIIGPREIDLAFSFQGNLGFQWGPRISVPWSVEDVRTAVNWAIAPPRCAKPILWMVCPFYRIGLSPRSWEADSAWKHWGKAGHWCFPGGCGPEFSVETPASDVYGHFELSGQSLPFQPLNDQFKWQLSLPFVSKGRTGRWLGRVRFSSAERYLQMSFFMMGNGRFPLASGQSVLTSSTRDTDTTSENLPIVISTIEETRPVWLRIGTTEKLEPTGYAFDLIPWPLLFDSQ